MGRKKKKEKEEKEEEQKKEKISFNQKHNLANIKVDLDDYRRVVPVLKLKGFKLKDILKIVEEAIKDDEITHQLLERERGKNKSEGDKGQESDFRDNLLKMLLEVE